MTHSLLDIVLLPSSQPLPRQPSSSWGIFSGPRSPWRRWNSWAAAHTCYILIFWLRRVSDPQPVHNRSLRDPVSWALGFWLQRFWTQSGTCPRDRTLLMLWKSPCYRRNVWRPISCQAWREWPFCGAGLHQKVLACMKIILHNGIPEGSIVNLKETSWILAISSGSSISFSSSMFNGLSGLQMISLTFSLLKCCVEAACITKAVNVGNPLSLNSLIEWEGFRR